MAVEVGAQFSNGITMALRGAAKELLGLKRDIRLRPRHWGPGGGEGLSADGRAGKATVAALAH